MINARGIPTASCPNCGSNQIKAVVQLDPSDYEIGMYFLDAECNNCSTLLTLATPLDKIEEN